MVLVAPSSLGTARGWISPTRPNGDRAMAAPLLERSSSISVPTIVAALLGAACVGLLWAATASSSRVNTIEGPLKLNYTIQTSPTTSEGSRIEEVSRIEFHPNYVVVRGKHGSG